MRSYSITVRWKTESGTKWRNTLHENVKANDEHTARRAVLVTYLDRNLRVRSLDVWEEVGA